MITLTKEALDARIARNVAAIFDDVDDSFVINLGVGIPTKVSDYITNENIFVHAENGMLGVGGLANKAQEHPKLINASRQPVLQTTGCSFMDSCTAFGMIRGGRIDATVLGAFQVDKNANVSNWIIPNGKQLGVGGAMDLVVGAKMVIIAMTHTNKGRLKLVETCDLPITGYGEVDIIVTEMGVFHFENGRFVLKKIAPNVTVEEIKKVTEFEFHISAKLETMVE